METAAAAGISRGSAAIASLTNAAAGSRVAVDAVVHRAAGFALRRGASSVRFSSSSLKSNLCFTGSEVLSSMAGSYQGKGRMESVKVTAAPGARAQAAQVLEEDVVAAPKEECTIVDVDLGDRSYPIYIGKGLLNRPELLQKYVIRPTNQTVAWNPLLMLWYCAFFVVVARLCPLRRAEVLSTSFFSSFRQIWIAYGLWNLHSDFETL